MPMLLGVPGALKGLESWPPQERKPRADCRSAALLTMLTVTAPDRTTIRFGKFGRHQVGLEGPQISAEQFELEAVPGSETRLRLRNLGHNPIVLAQQLPDGAEGIVDLLERSETADLRDGQYFYLPSLKDSTTFTVGSTTEGARRGGGSAADDDDDSEVEILEPDPKRPRLDPPAPLEPQPASLAAPFALLRVQGIPEMANRPPMGMRLRHLLQAGIKWILVSNFEVDLGWLLSECPELTRAGKILIVHGESHPAILEAMRDAAHSRGLQDRLIVHAPPLPIDFGTHHSKAFLVEYERGLRVVVHTANLVHSDNNFKSQGVWTQDFPPKDASSPTSSAFESSLVDYLKGLRLPRTEAEHVMRLCQGHDFSSARGILIASRPGYHRGSDVNRWGHMALRAALEKAEFEDHFCGSPVFAQFSSMGSLDSKWLFEEFQATLSAGKTSGNRKLGKGPAKASALKLIWPTVEEVQNSVEGWAAGRSIPGQGKNVQKPFLGPLFHRFGGGPAGRQRAMPHIKSYGRFRVVGDAAEVAWLLLTSHNLSKAAWGALQKQGTQLMIRSYELGVLMLPSLHAAYRAHRHCGFCCTDGPPPIQLPDGGQASETQFWARRSPTEVGSDPARVLLPLPYPLPPSAYAGGDGPWFVDGNVQGVDSHGRRLRDGFPSLYGEVQAD